MDVGHSVEISTNSKVGPLNRGRHSLYTTGLLEVNVSDIYISVRIHLYMKYFHIYCLTLTRVLAIVWSAHDVFNL